MLHKVQHIATRLPISPHNKYTVAVGTSYTRRYRLFCDSSSTVDICCSTGAPALSFDYSLNAATQSIHFSHPCLAAPHHYRQKCDNTADTDATIPVSPRVCCCCRCYCRYSTLARAFVLQVVAATCVPRRFPQLLSATINAAFTFKAKSCFEAAKELSSC